MVMKKAPSHAQAKVFAFLFIIVLGLYLARLANNLLDTVAALRSEIASPRGHRLFAWIRLRAPLERAYRA